MAYTEALTKAGVLAGSDRLQPTSAATTVRLVDGKPQVLDGPYIDSKEQLGGYFLIEVADLDAAISWAARCPAASSRRGRGAPVLGDGIGRDEFRRRRRRRRAARQTRWRAAATASWSPFSRRARATWRPPRTRLSEAFAAALADWPRRAARRTRKLADDRGAAKDHRSGPAPAHAARRRRGQLQLMAEGLDAAPRAAEIPDQRLALMFACAHPAIEAGIRAPLMLQVVLGLDAKTIASAFLVVAGGHGQAAGARQGQDPAGRHSLPRPGARGACRRGSTRCWRRSTRRSPKAGPTRAGPMSRGAI